MADDEARCGLFRGESAGIMEGRRNVRKEKATALGDAQLEERWRTHWRRRWRDRRVRTVIDRCSRDAPAVAEVAHDYVDRLYGYYLPPGRRSRRCGTSSRIAPPCDAPMATSVTRASEGLAVRDRDERLVETSSVCEDAETRTTSLDDFDDDADEFSLFQTIAIEDPFRRRAAPRLPATLPGRGRPRGLRLDHAGVPAPLILTVVHGFSCRGGVDPRVPLALLSRLHRGRKQLEHGLWDYAVANGLITTADEVHDHRLPRSRPPDVGLPRARAGRSQWPSSRVTSRRASAAAVSSSSAGICGELVADKDRVPAMPAELKARRSSSSSTTPNGVGGAVMTELHIDGGDLLSQDAIRSVVREVYGGVTPTTGGSLSACTRPRRSLPLPDETVRMALRVGNPVRHAGLHPGEDVAV